jgi:RNA polymerase-binding transcription factor DksA
MTMIRAREISQVQKLKEEREQTFQVLERLRETVELEVESRADEGNADLAERDKTMALMRSLEYKLSSIGHALQQAQKGMYGICEGCGRPIDPARLEALPETTLCVQCKVIIESHR